jgi:hypothetical protein
MTGWADWAKLPGWGRGLIGSSFSDGGEGGHCPKASQSRGIQHRKEPKRVTLCELSCSEKQQTSRLPSQGSLAIFAQASGQQEKRTFARKLAALQQENLALWISTHKDQLCSGACEGNPSWLSLGSRELAQLRASLQHGDPRQPLSGRGRQRQAELRPWRRELGRGRARLAQQSGQQGSERKAELQRS